MISTMDLPQKAMDIKHLMFNRRNSDRILRFKEFTINFLAFNLCPG
jgi:hypothetical protein